MTFSWIIRWALTVGDSITRSSIARNTAVIELLLCGGSVEEASVEETVEEASRGEEIANVPLGTCTLETLEGPGAWWSAVRSANGGGAKGKRFWTIGPRIADS